MELLVVRDFRGDRLKMLLYFLQMLLDPCAGYTDHPFEKSALKI